MQDVQNIPIDIHANRLLDWLISRHHCSKDWPDKIATIRQKINLAIGDMPENPTITKILAEASPINYYHCVKIVEVLKETEADTKNIFGSYGSRRMKDWQDILKSYQKENLYICESASILARNVIYEVPALKRLINKLEQAQAESIKKEATCKKQAQDYRDKFSSSCKQLGLPLDSQNNPSIAAVGKQLVHQMNQELPAIFEKIANKAKDVKDAVLYYKKFLDNNIALSKEEREASIELLQFVIEKGNLTTYEFKHKEPPLKIEVPELNYTFEDVEDQQQIGNDNTNGDDAGGIDFGDVDFGGDDIVLETGDIDWGDIETATDEGAGGDQIDFSLDNVDTVGIILEEDGIEGGVARNQEALSVLENPDTREQFINDIIELEGFLSQRIDETKALKPNEVMLSTQDDAVSLETLEKWHKNVIQLNNLFNENKTKQFLLVRESKRYVIRIAESLLQNLRLAKKSDFLSQEAKARAVQCTKEADDVRPKIQTLTKQCKELQQELTKEISAMYNNRTVYLTVNL